MDKANEDLKKTMADALLDIKVDEIVNEINDYTGQVMSLNLMISTREKELKEICPHTYTKEINKYYEGGYLDRGSHVWTLVCKTCGTELDRKETDTGYA